MVIRFLALVFTLILISINSFAKDGSDLCGDNICVKFELVCNFEGETLVGTPPDKVIINGWLHTGDIGEIIQMMVI